LKEGKYRAKKFRHIVLKFLNDNEEERQKLIVWFLNDMINEEVNQQTELLKYPRLITRRNHRTGFGLDF
jgi:hypothetical protein